MTIKPTTVEMLKGRVNRARNNGMSDGIIRAGLIAEGWGEDDVIEAMEGPHGKG